MKKLLMCLALLLSDKVILIVTKGEETKAYPYNMTEDEFDETMNSNWE